VTATTALRPAPTGFGNRTLRARARGNQSVRRAPVRARNASQSSAGDGRERTMDDVARRWSATRTDGGTAREVLLDDGRGRGGRYPCAWLRNNCQCPDCAAAPSGFRKLVIRDFPFRCAPVRLQVSASRSGGYAWCSIGVVFGTLARF